MWGKATGTLQAAVAFAASTETNSLVFSSAFPASLKNSPLAGTVS